ncbi:MAG: phage terminase large subunit family protein [Planctomycetota bacterium]|nr:phage terminase large subunit family protein [Planctomycetota bacterium]
MFQRDATKPKPRKPRETATRQKARAYHAERMKANRAAAYDIEIPQPADLARRAAMLADPYEFMRLCFPTIFYQPFTASRRDLVEAIRYAGTTGGKQAWADARAGGKTRLALFVGLWLELAGFQDFIMVVSKSGYRAALELSNLKDALQNSVVLSQDFPEIGLPIQSLRGQAKMQTAYGEPTRMGWTGGNLILPTIDTGLLHAHHWPETLTSLATGQIWSSLGILGPIRGYVVRNRRPGLAIVDDIDDRGSARSELQTENRIGIINEDISGLGGSDRRCAVVYLSTIPNRTSCAFHFTDPKLSPAWNPRRTKLITSPPIRLDLWKEYTQLRRGKEPEDQDARAAHRFYLANRTEMDRGATTSNEFHFDATPLRDGGPAQMSTIQSYYDWVADNGEDSAKSELQNDPPADDSQGLGILTAHHIRNDCESGLARRVVPDDCCLLTIGVDPKKDGAHFVILASNETAAGSIIEHYFWRFDATAGLKVSVCEVQILDGLLSLWEHLTTEPFTTADGRTKGIDGLLCDSGWKDSEWAGQPVYHFFARAGALVLPSKGIANYRPPKPQRGLIIGDNWHLDQFGNPPLCGFNPDAYKLSVQNGFLADSGEPGSLTLFSLPDDASRELKDRRKEFSEHIVSERWITVPRPKFAPPTGQNHFLDACALAVLARNMAGLQTIKPAPRPEPVMPVQQQQQAERPRPTIQPRSRQW